MRKFITLLIIICIIIGCEKPVESNDTTLTKYIPRKVAVVLKTNDLEALQTDLVNNEFIQAFKETKAATFIFKQNILLKNLKTKGETLICYTKIGEKDYEVSLITKLHKDLLKLDSTQTKTQKIASLGKDSLYSYLIKDDVLIASTSTLLLENVTRETSQSETSDLLFKNAYQSVNENATASLLIKGKEGATLYNDLFPGSTINSLENNFSWAAIDFNLDSNGISTTGVVLTEKDAEAHYNLLRNTEPVVNRVADITPISFSALTSITYKDWSILKNNKANLIKADPLQFKMARESLFSSFEEVAVITIAKDQAIVAISNDPSISSGELSGNDLKETFRDVDIYSFKDNGAFAKAYAPLLNIPSISKYAVIADFYIFAENQAILETIIANYQNNATLSKSELFKNTSNQLSDASSYLYIENLENGYYKTRASKNGQKKLKEVKIDDYYYAASQLIQEGGYMLHNGLIHKDETSTTAGGVVQIASTKLNETIAKQPQLIRNHRTKGMDVITQDVNDVLYLISNAGKVLWQKKLDGPILGKVQQVDLYRNGRLQLAFTTPSTFYILDRNGKEVSPFPLSFNDKITQPLAVFDYDKNRKYRFIIVQDNKIMMYDKDAAPVEGFTFNEAGGSILFPPKHIRINNKDYITIAENTGKLHILNRVGKSRIDIEKSIEFGDTPIYKKGNTFETYTANAEKISINASGKLTQSISNYSSDSKITISSQLDVAQRENELYVNKEKKEIPYGSYTKPTIATVNKKSYTSITNTESKEVYIYDNKGELLPNFPVYGTAPADIHFLQRNKNLGFVTQGDDKTILIYKIN